ncbi:MAG TPA: hypothetical protein VM847_10955 [Tahibacter sp.]|nr:hypothetical protein [Tahibacter sp.]
MPARRYTIAAAPSLRCSAVGGARRRAADGSLAYRPEVDGRRAIAVAPVVPHHAAAIPRSGFVGVDLFLIISG